MTIPKALQMVLTDRIISDLRTKMQFIKKIPQKKLTQLFLDMCDSGIQQIIKSEQEKTPKLDPSSIMKKYYLQFKPMKRKM